MDKSRRWILVIAIMQLAFGVFLGMSNSKEGDKAMRHLATFEATERVVVEGGEERPSGAESCGPAP